jgi:hypothetical protein
LSLCFLFLAEPDIVWRLQQQHGGSAPIKIRTIALLASILVATSFVPSLRAEEIIKDKSPDGKFALRIHKGEEGWKPQKKETEKPQP